MSGYPGIKGRCPVKDKFGNNFSVFKNDPRLLSGELITAFSGMVTVHDTPGNFFNVKCGDPRLLTGEIVYMNTGKVSVIDKNGNTFRVNTDDYRFKTGEITSINSGRTDVIDVITHRTFKISTNDEKFLSGEYPSMRKKQVSAMTMEGLIISVSPKDDRFKSGEIKLIPNPPERRNYARAHELNCNSAANPV